MINNYFVLALLAKEWDHTFRGLALTDAYSHLPGELTLAFASRSRSMGLRVSTRPGQTFSFAEEDPRRPRSNVTPLLSVARGLTVESVSVADGDRVITLALGENARIELHPYGSRANVLFVRDGTVADAFKRADTLEGSPPPAPRSGNLPASAEEWTDALAGFDGDDLAAIRKRIPQLGAHLAQEVIFRGAGDAWTGLTSVLEDLANPAATCYDDGRLLFSPIRLEHRSDLPLAQFESVNEGVRWTAKRRMWRKRLDDIKRPLTTALTRSLDRWERRVGEIRSAETSESRADRYESFGHLLMANPSVVTHGRAEITLSDILTDGSDVTIPLDPKRSIIQNAEKYYDRARRLREEREHLAGRLDEAVRRRDEVRRLAERLATCETVKDVERFRRDNAAALSLHVGGRGPSVESRPFRRFELAGGYEVWVGRNARENDVLTFEHAARHDLWMHARGVPGSHVVVRVPGRDSKVEPSVIETAAAIAAWFSDARGSGLVPVQVAPRKYVSKPRGATAGVVRVQQEDVVLVEPRLPE